MKKNNIVGHRMTRFIKYACLILIFQGLITTSLAENDSSQTTTVSIRMENKTMKEVFSYIEANTEYIFVYNKNQVDVGRRVSLTADKQTVEAVLDKMFAGTGLEYLIKGRQIIVRKQETVNLSGLQGVAQQDNITVTGTVRDHLGELLIGVNILVEGTTKGTVTDINGNFTLENIPPEATLRVSYIGYRTERIQVQRRTSILITLQEEGGSIDEVVVIGYGTRTKKDLTGAVSQISSDEITKQVSMSPELSMQGKMAGIHIESPGSSPTARPTIRIRGVSTLGFNDPLYVIDGIPLSEGGASATDSRTKDVRGNINVFSLINANDIESISVLKDASATAIYGVRASNGVILITTKRGSEGKPKVSLSMSYGIQNIFKRYDVVSMQEYIDMSLEAIEANTSYNKEYWYPLFDKTSSNYMGNSPDYSDDWLDAALNKNAGIQDYNVSITGGTQKSNYAVGAGYTKQDDALYKDSYQRYSFSLNSDHQLTKWMKVGESYRFIHSKLNDRQTPDFRNMSLVTPWQPLYDPTRPDGLALPGRTIDGTFRGYGYGAATQGNFLGVDNHVRTENILLRNIGTFYAEVSPLQGLRFRGTFSFDYYTNKQEQYQEPERDLYGINGVIVDGVGNVYRLRNSENINIVKEFLIAYNNKFGKHGVDLVLNAMSQNIKWNVNQQEMSQNSPITSWEQRYINEGWPSEDKTLTYERYSSGLIGYMGRLSYNFDSRYYFDATVRRDGTSKFGPGYKWGTFPSFAGAWRMSSEKFMQSLTWLDDLKLRGGWGKSGNQETRDYAFLSMVNLNPKAAFGSVGGGDGTIYQAAALGDFPIVDMSWETVATFSLGFDLLALDNRLSFTTEFYNRNTDGILQSIVIPWTIGALNSPVINLAKVNNRGFEFQIGYNDRFGEVGVSATANLTTVRNRVSDLYRNQPTNDGDLRIEGGHSINYIYGYKTDGIFQTDSEVADWVANINDVGNSSQKSPGDVRFVDLNGAPTDDDPEGALKSYRPDGKIDDYDKTYLGKTIPGYFFGFTFGADYKNWDISLAFNGVGDVQKVNSLGRNSLSGGGQRFVTDYRDRWTPTNHSNTRPRAVQSDPSANNRISDLYVQNAGFLRFQNFQIGYNFQADLLSKIGVSNLRCYVSGSNLFVLSPYSDLDPENITTPTTFTIGANISF